MLVKHAEPSEKWQSPVRPSPAEIAWDFQIQPDVLLRPEMPSAYPRSREAGPAKSTLRRVPSGGGGALHLTHLHFAR